MKDDDFHTMLELASEMRWADAAKFIRSELGCSLIEAARIAERHVAEGFPHSLCADSFYGRQA